MQVVWDTERATWWFSVLYIIEVLTDQDGYTKNRNHWKYLTAKLKREGIQLVSETNRLKLSTSDGKRQLTDPLYYKEVVALAGQIPNARTSQFIKWFIYSDETTDG